MTSKRPGAQLAAQRRDRVRRVREVRDGAVGLDADRAPQRDDPVRQLARLGPGATMHPRRQPVGRVIGREHAHVVAAGHELLGQRLDVAGDSARVAPRVRRHEGDPHPTHPIGRARRPWCGKPAFIDRPILCEVSDRHFVKYTFLKVDPAWRRLDADARGARQAGVPRRLRGLRHRSPAAGLQPRGHPRRRRDHARRRGREPRPHPRVPRGAGRRRA